MFGAEIIFDMNMAGSRNVMIGIGNSKINFYDKPPKNETRGIIHHLGIETDDLEELVNHMESKGFTFINEIKDFGVWKYIMIEGPDHVLFELFEVVRDKIPKEQYSKITSIEKIEE
jgi:hypothetical protein